MRRLLALIALVLPLSAGWGVAPGGQAARPVETGSSRIVISRGFEDIEEERAFSTGAFDYERGTGVLESEFHPLRIVTPEAIYEELGEDVFWPEPRGKQRWSRTETHLLGETFLLPESQTYLMRFLRSAADSERVGTGIERGEQVTRYQARWYLGRVLEEFSPGEHEAVRKLFRDYWPESGEGGVPVALALDGDGRVRKAEFAIDDYGLGSEHLTIELFDYGVAVAAETPAASEVVTDDELERLAKKRAEACEKLRKDGGKEAAEEIQRYCFECHAGESEATESDLSAEPV